MENKIKDIKIEDGFEFETKCLKCGDIIKFKIEKSNKAT